VITFFDPSGAIARRANITFYQSHPDRLRVDIDHEGLILMQGYDRGNVWQARADNLGEEDQRNIRSWLRLWPNRLFASRAAGGAYRELGRQIEDSKQSAPWRHATALRPARPLDAVEVEDSIDLGIRRSPDRRAITYLVDRGTSTVYAARWMEPDDPTADVREGGDIPTRQVEVEYEGWRRINGILWPMEVTHRIGGSVDFRIDVKDVFFNQELSELIFQKP
jgi:hypothetical protein